MVSLFLSFQQKADGRHRLYHGTTIKSMRIVHSSSRNICFHANCSHWYFLNSVRYGCNQHWVAQIWQLKSSKPCLITKTNLPGKRCPVFYVRFCHVVFQLAVGRPWFCKIRQCLPTQQLLMSGITAG